jgi:hypothetical protein
MEPVTATVVIGALGGSALLKARQLRARRKAWHRAAESCGVHQVREVRRLGLLRGLRGTAGRLEVAIDASHGRFMAARTRLRVSGIARVGLRVQDFDTAVKKAFASDLEVGDPAFDAAVYVEGEAPVLQAVLDASTRMAVRRLLQHGILSDPSSGALFTGSARLQGGQLLAYVGEGVADFAGDGLPAALRGALDLARRLERPDDVAGRLARNASEDPLPEVRRRNLSMLKNEFPRAPTTAAALRDACRDSDDEVRLYAATQLGDEGQPLLRELARSSASDSCAARAIAALGPDFSAQEALDVLVWALPQQRAAIAIAGLAALPGRGGAEAMPEGTQRILIERALVHADPGVRAAAATALGRVGTVEAVLPLQDAIARGHPMVLRAAREAVAAIQSRLRGAAPGQLSVSGEEGGQLSLASVGGEVSWPEPKEPLP